MPKIEFTATPKLPADYKHFGYKAGDIITADADWCDKWVNRNVAKYVADEAAVETPANVEKLVVEIEAKTEKFEAEINRVAELTARKMVAQTEVGAQEVAAEPSTEDQPAGRRGRKPKQGD